MRTSKANENANQVDGFISQTYSIGELLGLTQTQFSADTYLSAAQFNNDPTGVLYYHIFFRAVDDDISSVTRSLLRVQLMLDVELWNATTATALVNLPTGPLPLSLTHIPPPPPPDPRKNAEESKAIG